MSVPSFSWKIYEAVRDVSEWGRPIEQHPKLSVQVTEGEVEIVIRDDAEKVTEKWLLTGEEVVLLLKKLTDRG